jgi:hypothetical protein
MSAGAELSSISTALDGLTQRIAVIAEQYSGTDRDDLAGALFEIERGLEGAHRRLEKVLGSLS